MTPLMGFYINKWDGKINLDERNNISSYGYLLLYSKLFVIVTVVVL